MRRRAPALLALALAACTASAPPGAGPSPAASPTISVGRPSPVGSFSAVRALALTRTIAARFPRREATSRAYARAAAYVTARLRAAGYDVNRQRVALPAGNVDGTAVGAGSTVNVIARPPGFDPTEPWAVVGAHLDTVPDTPGANDNATGVAVVLEAARLARLAPTPTQLVFVAFGAEERRRAGVAGGALGSRAFVRRLSGDERASLRGALIADMVGNGDAVVVVGPRDDVMTRRVLAVAAAERIPFRLLRPARFFSDDVAFRAAGIATVWLWAGDHASLHTPRDTIAVVQEAELRRVGTLVWETLRRLRI